MNLSDNKGFSLIEILVSMLILGIGILGMVGLQLNAMKFSHVASIRTQATFLAYDISDRMRANRTSAREGNYDIALSASAPSGDSIEDVDLSQWLTSLATQLPSGDGSITTTGDIVRVVIQWSEGNIDGDTEQQFIFETRL